MATITASAEGWIASLDLNSDYLHPNGDPESTTALRFFAPGDLFLAGERFGPSDNPDLTYIPAIQGTGYSFKYGAADGSDVTYGAFLGKTLDIGYVGAPRGPAPGDDHFSGTISGIEYQVGTQTRGVFPYVFTYADNPLSSAQASLNEGSVTFVGSDTATDILKVAGGALTHDDFIYGYGGNDTLEGGDGNDLIDGGTGNDILDGGAGNDRLFGGHETDQLFGREGNDYLDGGLGGDRMTGGTGNDTYVVDNIYDAVLEVSGQGTDTVLSSISYALPGTVENLTLTGTADINGTGNGLKNVLIGNAGNNVLDGGGWTDTLDGGGGADTLIGGADSDLFIFHKGEANGDVILGFAGLGAKYGDHIELIGYGPNASLEAVDATSNPGPEYGSAVAYHIIDGDSIETITIVGFAPPHYSDFAFV